MLDMTAGSPAVEMRPPQDPTGLASIVARAATLPERLHDRSINGEETVEISAFVEERLARWRRMLDPGSDPVVLERRLAWSGLTMADARRAIASFHPTARPDPNGHRPAWAAILEHLTDATARHFRAPTMLFSEVASPIDPYTPLAFEELLLPSVAAAVELLKAELARTGQRISPLLGEEALSGLTRALLAKLVQAAERTLFAELWRSLPLGHRLALKAEPEQVEPEQAEESARPRVAFERFVAEHGRSGLVTLLERYPVLGRVLAERVRQWVGASAELVRRLEADRAALAGFLGHDPGNVVRILGGLSDSHHDGRSVVAMRLESGARLVYKPRSLAVDAAFSDFLDWCNEALPHRLRHPAVLDRGDYGWMEYVAAEPLPEGCTAELFYEKAGALLMVVYLLGGHDCHKSNVVANGDQLVAIDIETLLMVEPAESLPTLIDEDRLQEPLTYDSVLKTGLLPTWEFSRDGTLAFDDSGLGATAGDATVGLRPQQQWRHVNTDDMHIHETRGVLTVLASTPQQGTTKIDPLDHQAALQRGFERAYAMCLARRDELKGARADLLAALATIRARFVLRSTRCYFDLLLHSYHPEQLGSGLDWSMQFERLARLDPDETEKPAIWDLLRSEIYQMQRLDIPYFSFRGDEPLITAPLEDRLGRAALAASGLDNVRTRLACLSAAHGADQSDLVAGAYAARSPMASMAPTPLGRAKEKSSETRPALGDAELLDKARDIALAIEQRAMWRRDRVEWVGFHRVETADRMQLEILPLGLYDGTLGIAIFLAAADRAAGEDRFAELWRTALRPLAQLAERPDPRGRSVGLGLGLAAGAGGVIYTCTVLADLAPAVDRPWLLEAARRVADAISAESIRDCTSFDVIGGHAGAVLGLLALHAATGDPAVASKARDCGLALAQRHRRLLDERQGAQERPLTGLSHGASGVVMALSRLQAVAPDPELAAAIEAALAYETGLLVQAAGNWPDLRQEHEAFMTSWCHGAPGIALARLDLARHEHHHDGCGCGGDLETAIATTRAVGRLAVDHLCCGTMGLVDVLLTTGRATGRAELVQAARSLATEVVGDAETRGSYRLLVGQSHPIFDPGMFRGMAGIGYELLRLARPDTFPSILHVEPPPPVGGTDEPAFARRKGLVHRRCAPARIIDGQSQLRATRCHGTSVAEDQCRAPLGTRGPTEPE